jgi:hypothetical protein
MKQLLFILFLVISIVNLDAQDLNLSNEGLIRDVRTQSNLAFKKHKLEDIIKNLTEDINISASNGEIISGKTTFANILNEAFKNSPDLYFVRNTSKVVINTMKDGAWEEGTWIALRHETSDWQSYGGNYSASWVKVDGVWKIKSELFVKLH